MFTIRFWVFNAWHIERAKKRTIRISRSTRLKGPTLRQFTYQLLNIEGCI